MKPVTRRAFGTLTVGAALGLAGCGGGSTNLPAPNAPGPVPNGTPEPAPNGTPGPAPQASELTGRIVYSQIGDKPSSDQDVYLTNANGSGRVLFKPDATASVNRDAAISRDGTRVVLLSLYNDGSGRSGLYTAASDGSALGPLVSDGIVSSPALSPNATRVAYVETRRIGTFGRPVDFIYVASVDGSSQPRPIPSVPGANENNYAASPAFSPDGHILAFVAGDANGAAQIYLTPADGLGEVRALTSSATAKGSPAFSPDGKTLAFLANVLGDSKIKIIGLDGRNERNVPALTGDKRRLTFSPDGKFLAYDSGDFNRLGAASQTPAVQIYITRADGSSQSRLLAAPNGSTSQYGPSWGR